MRPEAVNARLYDIYSSALPKLFAHWRPDDGDSRPMLLKVSEAYTSAPLRLAIIGQEAGGWGEQHPCEVEPLMNLYADFMASSAFSFSPFWQVARHIGTALTREYVRESHLWSNLVKIDVRRRRPSADLEGQVASLELLQHELSIAEPHAVLFQTGPRYDKRLLATFPKARLRSLVGGTAAVDGLPWPAVRTYHGRYLRMSRRWKELDAAIQHLRRLAMS